MNVSLDALPNNSSEKTYNKKIQYLKNLQIAKNFQGIMIMLLNGVINVKAVKNLTHFCNEYDETYENYNCTFNF